MSTGERVVAWTGLAEVSDQPLGGTELLAVPRSPYEVFGNLNVRRGRSLTDREAYKPIVKVGEAFFYLLLRGRDNRMAEAPAELHRHQSHDLHGLAGAGGLFDQDMAVGSAHIRNQSGLIGTERFPERGGHGNSLTAGWTRVSL
jgi:hypothetical protein